MKYSLKVIFVLIFSFSVVGQEPSTNPTPERQNVFGNKYNKIYYVGDCGEKWTIPYPKGLVHFADEKDAIDQGFTKSEKCTIQKRLPGIFGDRFRGNSSSRIFYESSCQEALLIDADKRESFATKKEAEDSGYEQSKVCTPIPKFEPPSEKPTSALNLAEIDTYLEKYEGRTIRLRGRLINTSADDIQSCYGYEFNVSFRGLLFELDDGSVNLAKRYFLLVTSSQDSEKVKKAIVKNGGYGVLGDYTFVIRRKGISEECVYGTLTSHQFKEN